MRVPCASLSLFVSLILLVGTEVAEAGHVTELASAFDKGDPYDVNLQVGYSHTLKRGAIKRELAGYADGIHIVKDLRFSEVRQVLSIRAEAAIFQDLQLHLEFPIVLRSSRRLSFAQNDGDPCGVPRETHCVTPSNSTLVRDAFFPATGLGADQVDIAGPDGGPGTGLFYLPNRSGIDQFHLGLSWAPVNQKRDSTKPTWVIGFEARIAVGEAMQHNPYWDPDPRRADDPTNPKGNTSVGRGYHQLHWFTTISKRYRYLDPWMSFFYMFPIATEDSLFNKTSFDLSGQERHNPRQRGGVEAGMEIVPWEKPKQHHKFSIELFAKLEGIFEGRGYSELWEVFANSPVLKGPCRPAPGSLFPENWRNGFYCEDSQTNPDAFIPYPGISKIENHLLFQGALAFNLDFSQYFRGRLGVSLGHEQQHFITFGDTGRDVDAEQGITYTNEKEVNPMFRPIFDAVGRRFRVADTTVFDFFASLEGRF